MAHPVGHVLFRKPGAIEYVYMTLHIIAQFGNTFLRSLEDDCAGLVPRPSRMGSVGKIRFAEQGAENGAIEDRGRKYGW